MVPSAMAFADPSGWAPLWPVALLTIAILTDRYDGRVARALGSASPGGQVFDHATDALFLVASLGGCVVSGTAPLLLPILIVVAFTQYVVDSFVLFHEKQLHMSQLGRWNGIFYFVPLVGIALARLPVPSGVESFLLAVSLGVCWLLVLSTIASIIDRGIAVARGPSSTRR